MSPHPPASAQMLYPPVLHSAKTLRTLLDRYLGRIVADYVLGYSAERVVYASVLFADIRDFTALAEATAEQTLYSEVNAYYEMLDKVITEHGGIVNDFGGDSILALFGAPTRLDDHAAAALRAAAQIMESLVELNEQRERNTRPPFRVGIGVNSGSMVMGNLGSPRRQTFTVLGDCVNSAKRLSDLSKDTPFYSIFASKQTIDDVSSKLPDTWIMDELGPIKVRGRRQTLQTYAITTDAFF